MSKLKKSDSWKLFNLISKRYDAINTVLSLGLHFYWKKRLVSCLPGKSSHIYLDLATGTADILNQIAKHNIKYKKLIGMDIANSMLDVGRKKLKKNKVFKSELVYGDAQDIPLDSSCVDGVLISFGIRNVNNINKAFSEILRVLKPESSLFILEFSKPSHFLIKPFHLLYLRTIVPFFGGLLSGNFKGYRYLDKTIETFLHGKGMCKALEKAGFKHVSYTPLTFGTVGIYQATKPS